MAVLRRPFEERNEKSTASYLRLVARNLFIDQIRASGRKPVLNDLDEKRLESKWESFAGDDGGDSRVAALKLCREELSERDRAALDLRYRDDESLEECAAKLDLGLEGFRSVIRRAKDGLRLCIEKRLGS